MTPKQVDQFLSEYRTNIGRCKYLDLVIEDLSAEIEQWEKEKINEMPIVKGVTYDDMPRGNTVGNPTERYGIRLADGYTPYALEKRKSELELYQMEQRGLRIAIHFVEAWLSGLTEKERWIIEAKVIDEKFWRQVVAEFESKYGECYSKEGLRKIKTMALEKIYKMAV